MTPRPSVARTRELETRLAAADARAETLERVNAQLLATLSALAPKGSGAPPLVPVAPLADASSKEPESPALTKLVWDTCEQLAFQDTRQESINRRVARSLAAQGKTEQQIIRALVRGETGA
jgi:hypothetical protein